MTAAARPAATRLLMTASGFAGLGYQIVWTQQCGLWLGHEAAAVLAVITAFFGGLAAGALLLGPRIERSAQPARWYAACELVVALWSLLLIALMSPFGDLVLQLTGVAPSALRQWSLAFGATFVLLLPATAAMGATLPAMAGIAARWPTAAPPRDRSIATLYACNTLGAVIGVLAIAFWLAPTFGYARTAALCVALNLACAVAALRLFRTATGPSAAARSAQQPASAGSSISGAGSRGLLLRFAVTGLLGIGYEVLVVRVLAQVAEDTVYTFALLLAVYLVGTAAGAAMYARLVHAAHAPSHDDEPVRDRLLAALAMACLIGTGCLWGAEALKTFVLQQLGTHMATALLAEAVLALVAFGPATMVMGALFSHLSAMASAQGLSFGRALGVNTLGAMTAPLLFGVLLFPALGPKAALLLVVAGYLLLIDVRQWRRARVMVPAAALAGVAVLAPPLAFVDVTDGGRVLRYADGVMAAVSVVEDADGVARLRIDNRQQEGSSATRRVDARQALLPVLLHPAPARALFLGLGTGVTASSAAEVPALAVDAVELLPEVIAAAALFRPEAAPSPRLHVLAADARRYVRASDARYDVIVSDNFHPARSGSGALYTVEHFRAVRERLRDDGLFCQWLPLHQLDLASLRSIVQSYLVAFPNARALLANNSLQTPVLGLVGRRDADGFAPARLRPAIERAAASAATGRLGLDDEWAVLGSFVAGPEALRRYAGDAAANTDDHPVVAYRAPRLAYAPDSRPQDRLTTLLSALSITPDELLTPAANTPETARRLAAYWQARDRFIASGRNVRPSSDPRQMAAQVAEPLLAVLRISPDFRPAYDPLLLIARGLARVDVDAARELLNALQRAQPARPEAAAALRELSGPAG